LIALGGRIETPCGASVPELDDSVALRAGAGFGAG